MNFHHLYLVILSRVWKKGSMQQGFPSLKKKVEKAFLLFPLFYLFTFFLYLDQL